MLLQWLAEVSLLPIDPPLPPDLVIEVYKQHVDRTLLRENLRLTVEQRILKLMQFDEFTAELRTAGKAATGQLPNNNSQ